MRHVCLLALVLAGCSQAPPPPPAGVLEIGVANGTTFVPLVNGDTVAVTLGPNGLNMIVPCLRSADIDPRAPDPTVTVEQGGVVIAADIEGARIDMKSDGTGYVLWNLRVPFQTELCCFLCRDALVRAVIRDASARNFEGTVTVRLKRGDCPDTKACCVTADACANPALAQICL